MKVVGLVLAPAGPPDEYRSQPEHCHHQRVHSRPYRFRCVDEECSEQERHHGRGEERSGQQPLVVVSEDLRMGKFPVAYGKEHRSCQRVQEELGKQEEPG